MIRRCQRTYCDWQSERDADTSAVEQLAAHAAESGHGLCTCCGKSKDEHAPRWSCEACLTAFRADVEVIVQLTAELPAHLRTIGSSALGGTRGGGDVTMPGGDALVLLGKGSDGGAARRLTRTDRPDAEGREHVADERDGDPVPVEWALGSWVQVWTEAREERMPSQDRNGGVRKVGRGDSEPSQVFGEVIGSAERHTG